MYNYYERDTGNAGHRDVYCAWIVAVTLFFGLFVLAIV